MVALNTSGQYIEPILSMDRARNGKRWEHFSHIADMGVRGYGDTLEEAFEQAAVAMTAIICDLSTVRTRQKVEIQCQAPDRELLLVDWLNALIYEMATRRMLYRDFEVHISGSHLQATAWGESVDRARHRPAVEAKGATYTELHITQQADGAWIAQCVIDI